MKLLSLLMMVGFLAFGTTSAQAQMAAKHHQNLDVPAFKKMMAEQDVVILDVRTPREFAQSKIVGAVNIPLNTISQKVATLDKSKKYLVYCRSGARSRRASMIMARQGLDVYNLARGFLAYSRHK